MCKSFERIRRRRAANPDALEATDRSPGCLSRALRFPTPITIELHEEALKLSEKLDYNIYDAMR